MPPIDIPFYENPAVWAVLVSGIAIFLSQVPPMKTWFKKAELDLEAYSKVSITQKLGNPNLQLHLLLTNIGGRKVRVKDINVTLSRDGTKLTTLPANSYLQNQNDPNPLLFTTFSLAPNQEWAHLTNFLNTFNRDEENEFHALDKDMLTDYRNQAKKIKEDEKNKDKLEEMLNRVEHQEELITRAKNFFDSKFIWEAGEYLMKINVITNDDKANMTRTYGFTIFESQAEQQKESTEQYKYGGDIWWELKNIKRTALPIKEA